VLENFACTLQKVVAHTQVKHIVVASMGELLGTLKGTIVNLVVRHVKKMVPSWSLPNAISFSRALSQGEGKTLQKVSLTPDDVAFLQ
ncbi:long-chain-fatty-acid--CoA ligase, partial [Escherichia coli]